MFSKKLLKLSDVQEITSLSRSQIYALIQKQKFIRPVKIARSSRWPLDAVLAWVDERIAERDAK
jgi:predicted DNA-binding transcriptional regulator AlpA